MSHTYQRPIYNPVKHLRWSVLVNLVYGFQLFTIFAKKLHRILYVILSLTYEAYKTSYRKNRSHKKRKIVWKHRQSTEKSQCYLEIYCLVLNTGGHFLKNRVCSEREKFFAGDFHIVLDKIEVDILQRKWYWIDHTGLRIFFQNDYSYKYEFCTKVFAPPILVSQASKFKTSGQNIEMKYLTCLVRKEILKHCASPNSSQQSFKLCISKALKS